MIVLIGYQPLDARLNPRPPEDELAQLEGDAANPDADAQAADADDSASDEDETGDAESRDDGAATDANAGSADGSSSNPTASDSASGSTANDAAVPADDSSQSSQDGSESSQQRVDVESQWSTLGAMSSGNRMLVYFNNAGASIACIALNDQRYSDLNDRFGYLGFMALENEEGGCRIHVVGPGTSAARAGLQAGDLLVRAGETPIASEADYEQWRATTEPGDAASVTVLRNGDEVTLEVELDRRPLELIHPTPEGTTDSAEVSYLLTLAQLGDRKIAFGEEELSQLPSLKNENWVVEQPDGETVEFSYLLTESDLKPFGVTGPLRIIKRYQLQPPEDLDDANAGFHLNYELVFRNEGDGPPIQFAYQQDGANGLPLEGWWYMYKLHPTRFGGAGMRDIVSKAFNGPHKMFTNPNIIERLEENPDNPATPLYDAPTPLQYVGVDAQYFTSALVAETRQGDEPPENYTFANVSALPIGPKDEVKSNRTDVTFRVTSPVRSIAANSEYRQSFKILAAPKLPEVLEKYGMGECITYGWFKVVAKPLQFILHMFYGLVGNYGIAIIMLTVLVRGAMLPIGRQQALNAKKMQELAPEMRRIADTYKNDMEKRAAAQRELFAKNNYNPLAGCLPIFIQMPIFVGLYRALSVDIELRQAALIPGIRWCSNLAAPDQFWNWSSFMPSFLASKTGFLGPYLNVLPLVSVVLMFVHQKMFTPPPTDEQQEMQHKMMKFMMIFMAFIFFRIPAGLCLYFITSSAWALGERLLLPRTPVTSVGSDNDSKKVNRKPSSPSKTATKKSKNRSKSKRR